MAIGLQQSISQEVGSRPKAGNKQTNKYTYMKKILTSIVAITASAFMATAADEAKPAEAKPAAAAEGGKKGAGKKGAANPEEAMKKLDSNNDGSISLDEFKAGPMGKKDPTKAEEIFKKKDKDSDGKLSKEEFAGGHKKK